MAKSVDHGLGGKDNAKSRERRARKAERQKEVAHKALKVVKKKKTIIKEVVYDDDARVAYLTNFRQRKTERRKFGLAMQIVKDKKAHKDSIKDRRAVLKLAQAGPETLKRKKRNGQAESSDDEEEEEEEEEKEEEDRKSSKTNAVFADETTVDMFGGEVAVEIGSDIEEEDDTVTPELKHYMQERTARLQGQQLSKFEKAVKKVQASGVLSQKKKKKHKKREGDEEATGPPKKGKGPAAKGSRPGSNSKAQTKYARVAKVKGLLAKAGASKGGHSTFKGGSKK